MLDAKELLSVCEDNEVEYLEAIYYDDKSDKYHAVSLYPNGNYYVTNDIMYKCDFTGPFTEQDLEELLPSTVAWSKAVNREVEVSLPEAWYELTAKLTHRIRAIEDARAKIKEENWAIYATTDTALSKSIKRKIAKIEPSIKNQGLEAILTFRVLAHELTELEMSELTFWFRDLLFDGVDLDGLMSDSSVRIYSISRLCSI